MYKTFIFISLVLFYMIATNNIDTSAQTYVTHGIITESKFVDSLPGVLVIRVDDGYKECADSFDVMTGITTAPYTGLPWVGTHFISSGFQRYYDAVSGNDTSATVYATPRAKTSRLSVGDLNRFTAAGWEIGMHNRLKYFVGDTDGDGGDNDFWATDRFEKADSSEWYWENDILLSQEDRAIMGLPKAKTMTYPYHNSAYFLYQTIKKAGIEYACGSKQLCVSDGNWNDGASFSTHLPLAQLGVRGTGGIDGATYYALPMVHGDLPHPYHISYNGGKGPTLEENKVALIRAIEYGGAMIYHLHYPSEVSDGSLSEFLIFADSLRNEGLLVSKTFHDACKWFYEKEPSPTCNLLNPHFADVDSGFSFDADHMDKLYFENSDYTREWDVGPFGKRTVVVQLKRNHQHEGDLSTLETRNIVWVINNVGKPGQRYQFNLMVQYDEDACVPVAGDSIGVTIKVFSDVLPRVLGEGHWGETRLRGGWSSANPSESAISRGNSHWDDNSSGVVLGTEVITDRREDAGKWQQIRCDVPAGDGDLLYVIFWVGNELCGNVVRAAYPALYVYDSR